MAALGSERRDSVCASNDDDDDDELRSNDSVCSCCCAAATAARANNDSADNSVNLDDDEATAGAPSDRHRPSNASSGGAAGGGSCCARHPSAASVAATGSEPSAEKTDCDQDEDEEGHVEGGGGGGGGQRQPPPQEQPAAQKAGSESEVQERELALVKRRYVLAELVETERDYVNDLGKIVEGYLEEIRRQLVGSGVADILTTGVVPQPAQVSSGAGQAQQLEAQAAPQQLGAQRQDQAATAAELGQQQQQDASNQQQQPPPPPTLGPKLPDALKDGKHKIIFGNIEAIFEFHRDHFLAELERCLDEPSRLGTLFKRYERRLNMYVVYCQNKPRSEAIVSDHLDTYFEVSSSSGKLGLSPESSSAWRCATRRSFVRRDALCVRCAHSTRPSGAGLRHFRRSRV